MLRSDQADERRPGATGPLRRPGAGAFADGSGYQTNREAVPLFLLGRQKTRSRSGTVSVLPSDRFGGVGDSMASGATR